MDEPINAKDLASLHEKLNAAIEEDRRYRLVNDVKCDAIHTSKTYDEFKDRVAAAHLLPLTKMDKVKREHCKTVWNSVAESMKKI